MPVLSPHMLTSRSFGVHTLFSRSTIPHFVPSRVVLVVTVMMAMVWMLAILFTCRMQHCILRHELVCPKIPLMMVMVMMAVACALVIVGAVAVILARTVVRRWR